MLTKVQELEEIAAKLLETARKLRPGQDRHNALREIGRFRARITALKGPHLRRAHRGLKAKGEMTMRVLVILAALCFSTSAYAQAASPKVGSKPLVQVKPKEPMGCRFVGTVRGTKLWAGDCTGSELRGSATATETQSLPERATGVIPPGQKQ